MSFVHAGSHYKSQPLQADCSQVEISLCPATAKRVRREQANDARPRPKYRAKTGALGSLSYFERIIEADKINMMLKKSWHHTGGSTSVPIVLIVVKLTFESLCDGKKTLS